MNHTPTKPSSPSPKPGAASGKPGGRAPWPPRLFAVGAVVLLVVSGLVVVISGMMKGTTPHDAAQEQSSYASDALSRINEMGSLDSGGDTRGRDLPIDTDIGAAEVEQLADEIAAAQAALDAALAEADNLPAIPEGYFPGMDLGTSIPSVRAGPYQLPAFDVHLVVGEYTEVGLDADGSPVVPRTGLHLPSTGNPTVDDALSQLVGACAALRDMVGAGGLPVPGVPALPVPVGVPADPCAIQGLGGLPVSDPLAPLGGLPTGDPTGLLSGIVPTDTPLGDPSGLLGGLPTGDPSGEVQGANDAIDPDEAGAVVAQLHAGNVIGVTDAAYDQANTTLHGLLATYSGLAAQLQDLLDQAQEDADAAAEAIPALLEERLAGIAKQAAELRADAERMAVAYTRTAQTSAEAALGIVQDAVAAHRADLQTTLDSEVAKLNARAGELMSRAASRSAAIQALVDSSVANLTRMAAESGVDASAQIAAIEAAGDAAVKGLAADAKAQVEVLKETAALLQARAQAAVPRITAMGLRAAEAVNATLEDALAQAELAKAYLLDFVAAQAGLLEQAERRAAGLALDRLEAALEDYTSGLKDTALAMTSSVPDVVGSTSALVQEASDVAATEVDKDLDYILKVAEDYSKVPTEERRARALFWNTVNDMDVQALADLAGAGDELTDLAVLVMDAADLARADVEAVAGI